MKVLILDTVHPSLISGLRELGFEVDEDYKSSAPQLRAILPKYTGLVIRSRLPVDAELLSRATDLKFIGRVGAGLENIDLETAHRMGIQTLNAPEGNRNAVAEHALGMLLMLFNNLRRADAEVRRGIWKREANRGLELEGKTLGIIGYGQMGSAFAEKLRAFDMKIMAHDKYKKGFGSEKVRESSLEELQAHCDIISLHLPQTEETLHYVDEEFIRRLKKPFYLVNTARGKVVQTKALVQGLQSGKVLGACLDVLEYEKSSFENLFEREIPGDLQYLLQSDKVILSPHIAGWSQESNEKMARVIVRKVAALNLI